MQEEKLTLEVSTHDIASCNICYARNYDSTNGDAIGERVDKPEAYNGQIVLFTGTEFIARDKLGQSYRYCMIGAEVTCDGLIRLLNLDTGLLTYVEPEYG